MTRQIPLFSVLAVLIVTLGTASAQAPKVDVGVQKTFDKLIAAVKAGDREAFVADATAAVKEGMTKELMKKLKDGIGSRLRGGFEATYLCEVKQEGYQVYLWKATFKDAGDDVIVRLVLKKGKVAGFFLQ